MPIVSIAEYEQCILHYSQTEKMEEKVRMGTPAWVGRKARESLDKNLLEFTNMAGSNSAAYLYIPNII